jgi:hypothetical protein
MAHQHLYEAEAAVEQTVQPLRVRRVRALHVAHGLDAALRWMEAEGLLIGRAA